jgi:hypothetical protein
MQVDMVLEARESLDDWRNMTESIVVGTREQLPGCGGDLERSKDYRIIVWPRNVAVCGYDDPGALFGLYNLEARMNLREGPFISRDWNTVRRSLYRTRMALSSMGWMDWPDNLLSHLAHDGFDAIFASVYANPNGDRGPADSSTEFYARLLFWVRRQDPARVRDLIDRSARFGIKVYTPVIYQYLGTPESEARLRKLVREIHKVFPDIAGHILLTEGFYYKE